MLLDEQVMVCLSIYPLMDIHIPFAVRGSSKLLGTFTYKSLCGYMLSFLLDKKLGVEHLGHMIGICLRI